MLPWPCCGSPAHFVVEPAGSLDVAPRRKCNLPCQSLYFFIVSVFLLLEAHDGDAAFLAWRLGRVHIEELRTIRKVHVTNMQMSLSIIAVWLVHAHGVAAAWREDKRRSEDNGHTSSG